MEKQGIVVETCVDKNNSIIVILCHVERFSPFYKVSLIPAIKHPSVREERISFVICFNVRTVQLP